MFHLGTSLQWDEGFEDLGHFTQQVTQQVD